MTQNFPGSYWRQQQYHSASHMFGVLQPSAFYLEEENLTMIKGSSSDARTSHSLSPAISRGHSQAGTTIFMNWSNACLMAPAVLSLLWFSRALIGPLGQHQILPNIYKIYCLRLIFLPFVAPILTDGSVNYFMKRIFLRFPRKLVIIFYLKYLLSNNNVDISRPKQLMSPCIKL